jgi:hypothetical protein
MKYKRAFFVAFVVLIVGLGMNWYSTNQINADIQAQRVPDFQWYQYQLYGLLTFGCGVALFAFFIGIAIKNWIGM